MGGINYNEIKNKTGVFIQAIKYYIEGRSGIDNVINELKNAQKIGALTSKQLFDLKKMYLDANSEIYKIDNENIIENKAKDIECNKICTKCKEKKLISLFGKLKEGKNGLNPVCKKCYNVRQLAYFKKNDYRWQKKLNLERPIYRKRANDNYSKTEKYFTSQVKKCLIKQGFTKDTILENPLLIECKEILIKTKRLCKT